MYYYDRCVILLDPSVQFVTPTTYLIILETTINSYYSVSFVLFFFFFSFLDRCENKLPHWTEYEFTHILSKVKGWGNNNKKILLSFYSDVFTVVIIGD